MDVSTLDLRDADEMVKSMERILEHRKAHPTVPSSIAFYEAYVWYYRRWAYSHLEGRPLVLHSAFAPAEIFHAMDLAYTHASFGVGGQAQVLKKQAEYLEAAGTYGVAWEMCGGHRIVAGGGSLRRLPPIACAVSYHFGCTNAATSAVTIGEMHNIPTFYLHRPYTNKGDDDRVFRFYLDQLKDMIAFVEKHTGRKLNWDRLSECVRIERQIYELAYKALNLKSKVPCPWKHRSFMETYQTDMMMPGTEIALKYYQALLQEVEHFASKGTTALGPDHKERYRIMSCLMPPNWCRTFLDWMEKEHGISSVYEPYMGEWNFEMMDRLDPDKPLESLAWKYSQHILTMLACPFSDIHLPNLIKAAIERKADGAIYYASVNCNTSPHLLVCQKDALEKVNVPLLTLDDDIVDPAYVGEDGMRERLEAFLPIMDRYKEIRQKFGYGQNNKEER